MRIAGWIAYLRPLPMSLEGRGQSYLLQRSLSAETAFLRAVREQLSLLGLLLLAAVALATLFIAAHITRPIRQMVAAASAMEQGDWEAPLDRNRSDEMGFLAARFAIPLLSKSDNASIVNVTSTAGQRGEAGYSPYAASKGAMISATKSWAVELAPRIRVNSVAPGWVETDMTEDSLAGSGRSEIVATIPLGRVAPADDVAGPVLFLASPLARHVTGEILNVNGGSVLVG